MDGIDCKDGDGSWQMGRTATPTPTSFRPLKLRMKKTEAMQCKARDGSVIIFPSSLLFNTQSSRLCSKTSSNLQIEPVIISNKVAKKQGPSHARRICWLGKTGFRCSCLSSVSKEPMMIDLVSFLICDQVIRLMLKRQEKKTKSPTIAYNKNNEWRLVL